MDSVKIQRAVSDGEMAGQDAAAAPRPGKNSAGRRAPQDLRRPRTARADSKRFHIRRHGILSRNALEALVARGENIREFRKIEKLLRAELKPQGPLGELLFDRMWSSYLRCLLIGRTETNLFHGDDAPDSEPLPQLKAGDLPTLVWPEPGMSRVDFSPGLAKGLETVLRYDAHFSREFYRAVGLLLSMQDGGSKGILDCL
jgi:hypothetical protein